MNTALAPVVEFDSRRVGLIRDMLTKDINDTEFRLFVEIARHAGLDPLLKQIYAIKRGGKMTVQTGIDGYRAIASRTKAYAGNDDAIFDNEGAKNPGKATVTVYRFVRGEKCAFTASARWAEYNATNDQWRKMPYTMLAKCAEALALRKAFPTELAGMYTDEEMQQADRDDYPQPTAYIEAAQDGPETVDDAVNAMTNGELASASYALAGQLGIKKIDYAKVQATIINGGKLISPTAITREQRLKWYQHLCDTQDENERKLAEAGVEDYQPEASEEIDLATLDPNDLKVS